MKWLVGFALLIWTSALSDLQSDRLIIWNVGQGLWATIVSLDSCTHVDMGGEKIDWKKLAAACGSKSRNFALFSHWDLDHISFAERASKRLPGFCILKPPAGPSTPEKLRIFSRFATCDSIDSKVSEIKFTPQVSLKSKTGNDFSRIFESAFALFPGDSSAKQERIWSQKLAKYDLKYLVLGHHGSKTSTSEKLLNRLPQLKLAIASARKKRYGHPHRSVIERLDHHGIATLSTEQWNNILIELK